MELYIKSDSYGSLHYITNIRNANANSFLDQMVYKRNDEDICFMESNETLTNSFQINWGHPANECHTLKEIVLFLHPGSYHPFI